MKIAFCLYGIIGGMAGKDGIGGDIDFAKCCESYKKFIFGKNDVDVFIHTWSVHHQKVLNRIYNPKATLYEPQILFKTSGDWAGEKFRSCSRWYSTKQVLNLQKKYSEEKNLNYDFIMITRFDIMWLTPLDFSKLEKDIFYVSNWNGHKCNPKIRNNASFPDSKMKRYLDLWYIGNQEQMNHLSGIYDVIHKIGNKEYDQHKLAFDRMFPVYGSRTKFYGYYYGIDYDLYRSWITYRK